MKTRVWIHLPLFALVCLVVTTTSIHAAEKHTIEEIVVVAQRVEEKLREVPISASAFSETVIRDRQIMTLADIQFNAPNVSYLDQSFGNGRFSIRGLGRVNDEDRAENGVSVHLNGTPILANSQVQLLDLERLEILRGPQGTLYGRNATGGTVNIITNKPQVDSFTGMVEAEYGDYDHQQIKSVINVPVNERLAFRIAGLSLERNGFTKNLAHGQVPGVDGDLDGRDLWSARVTAKWWISDDLTLTLLYYRFDEDDDRLRNHFIDCQRNSVPTLACAPGKVGFDAPHPGGLWDAGTAVTYGALDPAARDSDTGLPLDFARPNVGFRRQHTDLEPIYLREEEGINLALDWQGERYSATLAAGYLEDELFSRQDDRLDVGYSFLPTPFVPSGMWPTSDLPIERFGTTKSDQCNVLEGTAGVRGGCILPVDQTRSFTYGQINRGLRQFAVEAKLHSQFDGPINFLTGVNYLHRSNESQFNRVTNVFDQLPLVGVPGFPVPLGPGFADITTEAHNFDTYSAFAELYWEPTTTLKFTLGARYNDDRTDISDRSLNVVTSIGVDVGSSSPEFVRSSLFGWLTSGTPSPGNTELTDLYGATELINAAPDFASRLEAIQQVPIIAAFNEQRILSGTPKSASWREVTARTGVSWTPNDRHMFYTFFTRGYKPGGINRSVGKAFDEEFVHTLEIGSKSLMFGETMRLHAAVFYSDQDGVQLDALDPQGSALTRNFDAKTLGAEAEVEWRPAFLPNLNVSLTYGWLDSQLNREFATDRTDPTLGNPAYTILRDSEGFIYTARINDVLPLVDAAIAAGQANPIPNSVYPNGIPSQFNRAFLAAQGVETPIRLTADIGGNELPSSPKHTVSLGLGYGWHFNRGSLYGRVDYYYQSENYARVFNKIDNLVASWEQTNASLSWESAGERWSVKGWVRNLTDEDNVNSTSEVTSTLGGGRNSILNDPRLYGITVQINLSATAR